MERVQHGTPAPDDPAERAAQRRKSLDRLLKIRIPLIVRLAEKPVPLEKVMSLTEGMVIEFAKSVEESLDLMANNKMIGGGEAVKIGEKFGLKIKSIGPPKDTIRKLGGGR